MTSLPVLARAFARPALAFGRHALARPAGPAAVAAVALLGTGMAAGLPAAQAATRQARGVHVIPGGAQAAATGSTGSSLLQSRGTTPTVVVTAAARRADVAPVGKLMSVDILVVSHSALPASAASRVARLPGVQAARAVDAARIQVNGKFVAMLGVDPSTFRDFAAGPTARSSQLWQNVAAGGIAVSYTMGQQDKLPLGGTVRVSGRRLESLRVGGFGTVGIGGVDAVVSAQVARSLGFPVGNAIMISAPHAQIASLVRKIKARMPRGALVQPLVSTAVTGRPAAAGAVGASAGVAASAGASGAGASGGTAGSGTVPSGQPGSTLSMAELIAMLKAAVSRVGMPYVWGAAGPSSFDCSGLVQWSFAQAGVVMPRVAADQARTGPAVPLSQLQPGDLLFYHTDPTAPDYVSHVAIYLGKGLEIQAPQPGQDVQIVPVWLGSEFAGAVQVDPAIAAQVAANPVG
ncbi:MAG: C40 family peptidase [Streptosporangiaceae bacterium]